MSEKQNGQSILRSVGCVLRNIGTKTPREIRNWEQCQADIKTENGQLVLAVLEQLEVNPPAVFENTVRLENWKSYPALSSANLSAMNDYSAKFLTILSLIESIEALGNLDPEGKHFEEQTELTRNRIRKALSLKFEDLDPSQAIQILNEVYQASETNH